MKGVFGTRSPTTLAFAVVDRLPLVGTARRRIGEAIETLYEPRGMPRVCYDEPAADPGIFGPDSVAWRVHQNGAAMFIGGVTAVLLELAEPRVRSGVWDHTEFRSDPVGRMRRTAAAAMVTTYGSKRDVARLAARVRRLHARVAGRTPEGRSYRADDPELLRWVHATAAYGFLNAHARYVEPRLRLADRDRYYAESARAAVVYGVRDAPRSVAEMEGYLEAMFSELRAHEIVGEFLRVVSSAPAVSYAATPLQRLFVEAAIDLLPAEVRHRLGLDSGQPLRISARPLVGLAVSLLGRIAPNPVAERAHRRMGIPGVEGAR